MPDNQSREKVEILKTLGAEVRVVPTVPYKDDDNYQKQAGRYAATLQDGIWANQFDNTANKLAHYESTGPEIWQDTDHDRFRRLFAQSAREARLQAYRKYLKEQSERRSDRAVGLHGERTV